MNTSWPQLRFEDYKETLSVVHLWAQIIGKIRLSKTPWINHSWHVSLYVSSKGFTTGAIPYGKGVFEIEFDFIKHLLTIQTSNGKMKNIVVIGAEKLSSIVNWEDRNTCCLFGDGAGALILTESKEGEGDIIESIIKADGTGEDALKIRVGGSRNPIKNYLPKREELISSATRIFIESIKTLGS